MGAAGFSEDSFPFVPINNILLLKSVSHLSVHLPAATSDIDQDFFMKKSNSG